MNWPPMVDAHVSENLDHADNEIWKSIAELPWETTGQEFDGALIGMLARVFTQFQSSLDANVVLTVAHKRPDLLLVLPEFGQTIINYLNDVSCEDWDWIIQTLTSALSIICGVEFSLSNTPFRKTAPKFLETKVAILQKSRADCLQASTLTLLIYKLCERLRHLSTRLTVVDTEMKAILGLISIMLYDNHYVILFPELMDVLQEKEFLDLLLYLSNASLRLPKLFYMSLVSNCLFLFLKTSPEQQDRLKQMVFDHRLGSDPRQAVECFHWMNAFVFASMFEYPEILKSMDWIRSNQITEKVKRHLDKKQAEEGTGRFCTFCCTFAQTFEYLLYVLHKESEPSMIQQFQNEMQNSGMIDLAMECSLNLMARINQFDDQDVEKADFYTITTSLDMLKTQSLLLSFLKLAIHRHPDNAKSCDVQSFMTSLIEMLKMWNSFMGRFQSTECTFYAEKLAQEMMDLISSLIYHKHGRRSSFLRISVDRSFIACGVVNDLLDVLNSTVLQINSKPEVINRIRKNTEVLFYVQRYVKAIKCSEFASMLDRVQKRLNESVALISANISMIEYRITKVSSEVRVTALKDNIEKTKAQLRELTTANSRTFGQSNSN